MEVHHISDTCHCFSGTGGQTLATDNADEFVLVAFLSLTDCTFLEDICEGC